MYKILKQIIVFLEQNNKVLVWIGTLAFASGFWIYFSIYNLNLYESVYYALIQFFGGVANPSSLGMENDPEGWKWIYLSGFLSLLTTTLLIIVKFSKEYIFEKVRESIVNESDKHIIICGLGLNNRYIIDSILEQQKKDKKKQQIIIIEKYSDNIYIDEYRKKEQCNVIIKDASKRSVLQYVGIDTAEYIIVSTGSDYLNLSIAENIYEENKASKREKKVQAYVHIEDNIIERNYNNKLDENINIFSYNENSVRALFTNDMILSENLDTVSKEDQVHLLVIGFGSLGQKCVVHAIETGHFYNAKKLKITIVDKDINQWKKFEHYYRYKAIEDVEVVFKNIDINSMAFNEEIIECFDDITNVIIALDEDNTTIMFLNDFVHKIKQNRYLKSSEIELPPIAVRFKIEINSLLSKIDKSIRKFGETSESSNINLIINSALDKKAKELYELYREQNSIDMELLEWDKLSYEEKDKNRTVADNIPIKKYTLEKLQKKYKDLQEYITLEKKISSHLHYNDLDEVTQKLIDMEHRRWNAYHIMQGWRQGTKRSNKYKVHICLVPTEKLESDYYIYDLNSWKVVYEELMNTPSIAL